MSVLVVENLQKSFGGVRAVDGVTFALEDGEVAALIGPNGAGKSTLFNVIDGQLAADAGRVRYLGQPLDPLSTAARTRLGIGRTFQVAQAFASMTALQNAQVALQAPHAPLSVGTALWHRHAD
ncbi:MAG TPA: ATP-binding cassette domain-containing protein, partial [Burkholderiaceae bacterium]|nr:ATP-binding cassette domain-containing protein [Burkholderiaceae bacterium]